MRHDLGLFLHEMIKVNPPIDKLSQHANAKVGAFCSSATEFWGRQKLLCAQPSVLCLPLIKSTLTKVSAREGFAGPDDRIVGVVRFQNPVVTVWWHWPLKWRVGERYFQLGSQFGIGQLGRS